MLSYRHGYHAGNHADALKHLVLLALLNKLLAKDKPFTYIDTHSGAGLYDLESEFASVNAEHHSGVGVLGEQAINDALLNQYRDQILGCNPSGGVRFYPGSPCLSQSLLRPTDKLQLIELHSAEIDALKANVGRDARVSIHQRDAFEGLLALTPPQPRRGLALIDPSYEDKQDYLRVVSTLQKVNRHWPVGVLALWYPLLAKQRDHGLTLVERLSRAGLPDLLDVRLIAEEQQEEFGMHGSGMLIINTPWLLEETLRPALDELVALMGSGASVSITRL
jgi:23S rRNA (adenine2030-N6)-methyltransferase